VKTRLFEQPSPDIVASGHTGSLSWLQPEAWHWLAPSMAVFFLGMFLFGQNRGGLHTFQSEIPPRFLAIAALAEPDMASYYVVANHSGNNTFRSTFEWTNDSHSLRTAPPMAQTNSVIQ
jgi:hypothetical protein